VATPAQIQAYASQNLPVPPGWGDAEAPFVPNGVTEEQVDAVVREFLLTQGPIKALDEALRNARYVRSVP
jgi:hypothetical protein